MTKDYVGGHHCAHPFTAFRSSVACCVHDATNEVRKSLSQRNVKGLKKTCERETGLHYQLLQARTRNTVLSSTHRHCSNPLRMASMAADRQKYDDPPVTEKVTHTRVRAEKVTATHRSANDGLRVQRPLMTRRGEQTRLVLVRWNWSSGSAQCGDD